MAGKENETAPANFCQHVSSFYFSFEGKLPIQPMYPHTKSILFPLLCPSYPSHFSPYKLSFFPRLPKSAISFPPNGIVVLNFHSGNVAFSTWNSFSSTFYLVGMQWESSMLSVNGILFEQPLLTCHILFLLLLKMISPSSLIPASSSLFSPYIALIGLPLKYHSSEYPVYLSD